MKKIQLLFLAIALAGLACIAPAKHHYISFKTAKEFQAFLIEKQGLTHC
ncbi:hypothetical protein [Pedobacter sp. SL55]|nr:hypothetical protein [Pedobacter sp. SL55]WAC40858.1 hypothetical protein OVA16_00275 [Pedobacter sp. SL55]